MKLGLSIFIILNLSAKIICAVTSQDIARQIQEHFQINQQVMTQMQAVAQLQQSPQGKVSKLELTQKLTETFASILQDSAVNYGGFLAWHQDYYTSSMLLLSGCMQHDPLRRKTTLNDCLAHWQDSLRSAEIYQCWQAAQFYIEISAQLLEVTYRQDINLDPLQLSCGLRVVGLQYKKALEYAKKAGQPDIVKRLDDKVAGLKKEENTLTWTYATRPAVWLWWAGISLATISVPMAYQAYFVPHTRLVKICAQLLKNHQFPITAAHDKATWEMILGQYLTTSNIEKLVNILCWRKNITEFKNAFVRLKPKSNKALSDDDLSFLRQELRLRC